MVVNNETEDLCGKDNKKKLKKKRQLRIRQDKPVLSMSIDVSRWNNEIMYSTCRHELLIMHRK